jgi:hypothetical protein
MGSVRAQIVVIFREHWARGHRHKKWTACRVPCPYASCSNRGLRQRARTPLPRVSTADVVGRRHVEQCAWGDYEVTLSNGKIGVGDTLDKVGE